MTTRRFLLPGLLGMMVLSARGQDVDPRVLEAENQRVAVIEKVKPAVVAVFAAGGQGGGSGVLISLDGKKGEGYALTNFHVVEGSGPIMQCGLADGILYDAVLVGLDKVGDVSLIKLQPKTPDHPDFPFAVMGNSDTVKTGDWSLALGNPFLLATDFNPTVTYGLVSGIHRYQYPAGTLLEYTDCIQVDTSINPGNSGGPLFNMDGELIGINGRGSFEKRGRVNSGVGYAISINQIKNFLGQLRAGLDTDHATLGATISRDKDEDEGGAARMVINDILDNADVHRRGLEEGDELVAFAGRPMTTVNQYKNTLGLYPKGWRVPLTYRHENERHEVLVRLMQLQRQQAEEGQPKPPPGNPQVKGPAVKPELAKLYDPKPGFANYYFNKLERERLLAGFAKHGDFSQVAGDWKLDAAATVKDRTTDAHIVLKEEPPGKGPDGKPSAGATTVHLQLGSLDYDLDPLKVDQDTARLKDPPGSGGLLMALYQYRRLLTLGAAGFGDHIHHGGREPFYPPSADGAPKSFPDLRVDTEVLVTEHAAIPVTWYFSLQDQTLLGFEVMVEPNTDPCEVYLSDYRLVDSRQLPHRIEVRYNDKQFGVFTVKSFVTSKK